MPRVRLVHVVAGTLGATVFAFGLGSSSVTSLHQAGSHLKWISLAVLLVPAGLLALRTRLTRSPALGVIGSAVILLVLAFESTAWSVDPGTTFKKAASLGLLVAAGLLLAVAVAAAPALAAPLSAGVVAGAAAYAVGSLLLLAVSEDDAVQLPTPGTPSRFRGLSENPNAVSLLCALVLPLAVWGCFGGRSRATRASAGVTAVLLYVVVGLSGSRGALLAVLTGLGAFALLVPRSRPARIVALGTAAGLFLIGYSVSNASILPTPASAVQATAATSAVETTPAPPARTIPSRPPPSPKPTRAQPSPKPTSAPAKTIPWDLQGHRLADEIGSGDSGPRTLFGDSGRLQAWRGAVAIGAKRPIAGYGFGTEAKAFVDRWAAFEGNLPENSYVGMFLQLGAVGVVLLLAFGVSTLIAARRALTGDRLLVAGLLGTFIAGATLAVEQSYVYAVGNLGTVPLWSAAFLLAGLAGRRRKPSHA
jgi:O-antigen ligase